ncbi:flagellar associated protein [Planoprotostelium fungivorum]|uniref:Flagellar associated protein n=1 Tax=Planoprotostelium fungivorum TaxID=1890364 RepID=A0A2P6N2X5_9EUKA|nr:flagellar associated protein [Planoprotostelium fungivorum]
MSLRQNALVAEKERRASLPWDDLSVREDPRVARAPLLEKPFASFKCVMRSSNFRVAVANRDAAQYHPISTYSPLATNAPSSENEDRDQARSRIATQGCTRTTGDRIPRMVTASEATQRNLIIMRLNSPILKLADFNSERQISKAVVREDGASLFCGSDDLIDQVQEGKKKDAFDELGFESSAFQDLEQEFQEVLSELVGDKSLEKFRVEYEKLHRALKKSHESEKRLIKRCRELNAEIVSNAAKVQTALKLSQEDQKTIGLLKKEIEKAWKMVDASHEKESQANSTIHKLKTEINNLTRLVEQGTGLSIGQEHSVKELLKIKEELTRDRDGQAAQITGLRTDISSLMDKVHGLESQKLDLEAEIHSMKDLLMGKQDEIDKEHRRKDLLEKELRELKASIENKQQDIKSKQQQIGQGQERIQRLELQLKEQKSLTEKALKDYESLNQRTQKLQQDLEEQISNNTQLLAENSQRQVELKAKEEEISGLELKETNSARYKDHLLKREVESSKESLKVEISSLEKEIDGYKKLSEIEKKRYDDLMRERDILNKSLVKAASSSNKQADMIKISDSTRANLEQEVQAYKTLCQEQRKNIYDLEKQIAEYIAEANESTKKYLQSMEEVKLREMNIFELQKKIAEGEAKLKQQQNLYEAVRSDRNLYSKNLIEAQDEITEMKRKFRIMNQQIEQLKEEIQSRDKDIVKEHFEHIKVQKERDSFKNELARLEAQIELAEQTIGSQQAEVQKLNHIIGEADSDRTRQKKEFDRVKNERNILGGQLIRKNDELALLYEKIKVQQSTLSKGEAQYHERLEDIRVLKIMIMDLKRELGLIRLKTSKVETLKNEVYHLERQLLQERTKVKALSEELENPMNIHRWRKLEGSDPTAYEMIQKIHTLQRRLIAKTEEVVEKDLAIQESEKKIEELQQQIKRLPGPQQAQKLSMYKHNLKEKEKQLKALSSQLNMYEVQVDTYKHDISSLTREFQEIQKRYWEVKRKEQLTVEMDKSLETSFLNSATRIMGGGFSSKPMTSTSGK